MRDKLESNSDVVLRLDVQGAATVRAMMPDAVLVFLCAESEAALARRLFKRGTESPAQYARRVETARREMSRLDEFDYVVVNGEGLEQAAARLGAIMDAEKSRRGGKRSRCENATWATRGARLLVPTSRRRARTTRNRKRSRSRLFHVVAGIISW